MDAELRVFVGRLEGLSPMEMSLELNAMPLQKRHRLMMSAFASQDAELSFFIGVALALDQDERDQLGAAMTIARDHFGQVISRSWHPDGHGYVLYYRPPGRVLVIQNDDGPMNQSTFLIKTIKLSGPSGTSLLALLWGRDSAALDVEEAKARASAEMQSSN